jgi:hypothetical protein
MALVQMKLVTGWEVSEDSIPQLGGPTINNTESDDSPGTMTKIEFEDDMVIFYFDKVISYLLLHMYIPLGLIHLYIFVLCRFVFTI